MRKLYLLLLLFCFSLAGSAQFNIDAGSTDYKQDFNSLTAGSWTNNTTLSGWYAKTDATASITSYGANTGSTTTAGLYAFGVAGTNALTDRALGWAPSNTFTGASATGKGYIAWRLKNNTGAPITSISVTWTGEQWRRDNTVAQSLVLSYKTGATVVDPAGTGWTAAGSTFASPINSTGGALDGNAPANRVADINVVISVNIPAGEEIMLRWEDLNDSGNDHFLAIDDVTINATTGVNNAPTITPSPNSINFGNVNVNTSSTSTTVTFTGSNLTPASGNLNVAISGTDASLFEVSNDNSTWSSSTTIPYLTGGGTIGSLYVRFTPQSSGAKSASVDITGGGLANTVSIPVSGSGTAVPVKLVISSITPSSPGVNAPFTVTVQAQDGSNVAQNVTTNTDVTLTVNTGTGTLGGTVSGTITAGSNSVNITGVTYNVAETGVVLTASATSGMSLTAGNSAAFNVIVASSATDYFRSKATGNWNATSTWESSSDGNTWMDATITPDFNANTITIRNGHTVSITAAVTADQVMIANGGVLNNSTGVLTVNDGAGDDITISGGGVLILANTSSPVLNTGTTVNVNTNGTLRLSRTGYTANGAGVNSSNYVYQNASVLEYTLSSTFSGSGVTYFPNVDANTIPIFRTTSAISGVGGGSPTVINGLFEPNANISFSGNGDKTFRNGITGTGNVSGSGTGKFIINGATAQLSGTGTLTPPTAGLEIGATTALSVASNKTISGDLSLVSGAAITLGNNNLVLSGNITGGNSTTYIKTNGTGALVLNNITTTPRTFPVGNSTYNPVTINNGDGLNWSVNVADAVDNAQSAFDPSKSVQRTWDITPSGTSTGATVTFQYNDGDVSQVGAGFNTAQDVKVMHKSTTWSPVSNAITPTGTAGGDRTVTISGFTQFSPFVITNISGVLPVRFTTLKATQRSNGIQIDWSNLTETGVASYSIERSANGISFTSLATKNATKNDGGKADYQYLDASATTGDFFYRIKATETSGKIVYSNIVRINTGKPTTDLVIYPNPVKKGSDLGIQISSLPAGKYFIKVYDARGRELSTRSLNHSGGALTESISLTNLQTGIYHVQISGGVQLQKQFIVQ